MSPFQTANLDPVEHPPQDPCRVGDGLFLAELDIALSEVLGVGALVDAGDGEGAPGPGRRLFEQQCDVAPIERPVPNTRLLVRLEPGGQRQELANFIGAEIEKFEERSSLEIDSHRGLQFRAHAGAGETLRRRRGMVPPDRLFAKRDLKDGMTAGGCAETAFRWL